MAGNWLPKGLVFAKQLAIGWELAPLRFGFCKAARNFWQFSPTRSIILHLISAPVNLIVSFRVELDLNRSWEVASKTISLPASYLSGPSFSSAVASTQRFFGLNQSPKGEESFSSRVFRLCQLQGCSLRQLQNFSVNFKVFLHHEAFYLVAGIVPLLRKWHFVFRVTLFAFPVGSFFFRDPARLFLTVFL